MPRELKIFLMTRNEEAFIEDWIRYHGHLFGFKNLYILDGSDDPRVLDIYEKYKKRGLTPFFSKANLNDMPEVMNKYMHQNKGDDNFLIKLDTDEFLARIDPISFQSTLFGRLIQIFSGRKRIWDWLRSSFFFKMSYRQKTLFNNDIVAKLNKLPVTGQKYKAAFAANSIPDSYEAIARPCRQITSFTSLDYTQFKSFFHSKSFVSVDLGSHRGVTTQDDGYIATGLVIIHYANTSVEDSVRRARQVLVSHGYIHENDDNRTCLEKLAVFKRRGEKKASHHKVDLYYEYLMALSNGRKMHPNRLNYFNVSNETRGKEVVLIKNTLALLPSE